MCASLLLLQHGLQGRIKVWQFNTPYTHCITYLSAPCFGSRQPLSNLTESALPLFRLQVVAAPYTLNYSASAARPADLRTSVGFPGGSGCPIRRREGAAAGSASRFLCGPIGSGWPVPKRTPETSRSAEARARISEPCGCGLTFAQWNQSMRLVWCWTAWPWFWLERLRPMLSKKQLTRWRRFGSPGVVVSLGRHTR